MTRRIIALLALLIYPLFAGQDSEPSKKRPVATYSIVARDPNTGQMGVAVQSHWFSVGSLVTWAQAGVGAVATQSFVLVDYGPQGLTLMSDGVSASDALAQLIAKDEGQAVRQVGMIDASGNVATHTGANAIVAAGGQTGDNYTVQANLMLSDQVWPKMAEAYENSTGDLADRMMAALEAAQGAGGDIRGRQSAAMLIVSGEKQDEPWKGVDLELRVEDHPEPLVELKRLIRVHKAYEHMNAGDLAIEHNDNEGALREYSRAMEMFPDNLEMKYWTAVALVNMGRKKESYAMFREVFSKDENWRTLLPRLPASNLMSEKLVKAVLKKTK